MNPELHYLNHVQNTSISKHCCRFGRAPRFQNYRKSMTDFRYEPKLSVNSRSCNFGFGKKMSLATKQCAPSPNKYNVSQFPNDNRAPVLGLSREQVVFGGTNVEVQRKSYLPPPGAYEISSTINNKTFTLKQRLKSELDKKDKFPGPGQYQLDGISNSGKYPNSKNKNVRTIILDSNRSQIQLKTFQNGPGSYDLFNMTSAFNKKQRKLSKRATLSGFGTSKRPGPQIANMIKLPGPGYYQQFSPFGDGESKIRSKTDYQ